eukprot:m51a1_g7674 putative ubiquitin-conjugating enzyme (407) ;mRNA; f:511662-515947
MSARINKEVETLRRDPPPGITAVPIDGNVRYFDVRLSGPKDSPYENGIFKLELFLTEEYPMEAPQVRFLTRIYHPNVDKVGRICLSILKPEGWSPALQIRTYVLREAQTFSWQAPNRAFVLVGDAYPHKDSFTDQGIFWGDELEKCVAMGIKVYGVQVGSSPECDDFYHEISDRSGGIYLALDQFSLINSMFMAVCYKEMSNEKVDQYRKELEREGQLDQGHKNMFGSLKRGGSKLRVPKDKPYDWWNKGAPGSPSWFLDGSKWFPRRVHVPVAAAAAAAAAPVAPAPPAKKAKARAQKRPRAQSDESEAEAPAKRARMLETKKVAPKKEYYVRGDNGEMWIARTVKVEGSTARVKWFEELRRFPDHYVLVEWKDTIPLLSIAGPAEMELDQRTGMFRRAGKVPAI